MKRLFKLLFWFLFSLIFLIGIPLLYLYFSISDSTDEAPVELYNSEVTFEQEIADLFERALSDEKNYDFTLSENEINTLIYAIIRQNINNDYYCSDEHKYIAIYSIEEKTPLIGGKDITVKHLYAKMNADEITFYATMNVLGIKTNLNFGFQITENSGVYTLIVNRLGLGKLNMMKGIGKFLRKPFLNAVGFTEEKVNADFESKNIPITFNSDDFSFSFKKADIGEIMAAYLMPDGENTVNNIIKELFSVITTPEGVLTFGFISGEEVRFGTLINLEPFACDPALYDNYKFAIEQPFDTENFIRNKTQTFLLNNLTGGDMKIRFTENEFNRLLYDKTSGYENFIYEIDFGDSSAAFSVRIDGIAADMKSATEIDFNFLVDINNLKSILTLSGNIVANTTQDEISIYISDTVIFGTVETDASFLFDIIAAHHDDFELMTYDEEAQAFLITAATFNSFMAIGGGETPLTVNRLHFVDNALEVYVAVNNSSLQQTINDTTDLLNDLLGDNFLDSNEFQGQDDLIDDLDQLFDEINAALNNPEQDLSTDQIDSLIDIINELNDDNQQELYNQIENSLSSNDGLIDLYDLLFGN